MDEARPDPYGVLRHVAAMDPPGRRTISTAEAQAVLAELAQREKDLLTIEGPSWRCYARSCSKSASLAASGRAPPVSCAPNSMVSCPPEPHRRSGVRSARPATTPAVSRSPSAARTVGISR